SRRQQKPATSESFFSLATFTDSITERTPEASVAIGFSQNTCLPASTAAFRCTGRNPGGVASNTTSTPLLITFWYASRPTKEVAGVAFPLSPHSFLRLCKLFCS